MQRNKKPRADEIVDERGRRRFHGAFTGGFSAGYYNTVGSNEGWKPSTFTSSRGNRATKKVQMAQDFMDNEDGLLGGVLATKEEFDTFGVKSNERAKLMADAVSAGSAVPGPVPSELIAPTSRPIGYRLLQCMGWKEGQGIGNRKRRRAQGDKRGDIGLLEGIDLSKLPKGAVIDNAVTFSALDDAVDVAKTFKPKADEYGLGFDPSRSHPEMFALQRLRGPSTGGSSGGVYSVSDLQLSRSSRDSNSKARGGGGWTERDQGGFAIDDGDDDVYDTGGPLDMPTLPSFSVPRDKSVDKSHSGLIKSAEAIPTARCRTDNRLPISGFVLESESNGEVQYKAHFPPPRVPEDFSGRHVFEDEEVQGQPEVDIVSATESGEKSGKGKLFSMLDAKGREQIQRALSMAKGQQQQQDSAPTKTVAEPNEECARPLLKGRGGNTLMSLGLAEALKGRFTSSTSTTSSEAVRMEGGMITAKEIQEKRAAMEITAPSSSLAPSISTEKNHAVRRTSTVWVPNRLLCKRMNVPVPEVSAAIPETPSSGARGREDEIFDRHIGAFTHGAPDSNDVIPRDTPAPLEVASQEAKRTPAPPVTQSQALEEDEEERPQKPPMSLFKSIFEDSDDSSDDESDTSCEEGGDGDANRSEPESVVKTPGANEISESSATERKVDAPTVAPAEAPYNEKAELLKERYVTGVDPDHESGVASSPEDKDRLTSKIVFRKPSETHTGSSHGRSAIPGRRRGGRTQYKPLVLGGKDDLEISDAENRVMKDRLSRITSAPVSAANKSTMDKLLASLKHDDHGDKGSDDSESSSSEDDRKSKKSKKSSHKSSKKHKKERKHSHKGESTRTKKSKKRRREE